MGRTARTMAHGVGEKHSKTASALPLAHLVSGLSSSPIYGTVVESLVRAVEEDGERLFIGMLNGNRSPILLTYRDVLDEACRVAAYLQSRGLRKGAKVLSLLPTGPGALAAFFGTQIGGGVPVPGNPPVIAKGDDPGRHLALLERFIGDADAQFLVVTEKDAGFLASMVEADNDLEGLVVDGAWQDMSVDAATWVEPEPDDVALIQYTSGPVTVPRGVVLSHRAVMANVFATGLALEVTRDDVSLSWLPLSQDFGLIGVVLSSLYYRYPMYLMRPEAFLLRPHTWLQEVSRFGVTITAAPNFAYEMCLRRVRDRHMDGLDLSTWRVALSGAETVDPNTVAAFETKFAVAGFKKGAFLPAYGLAENGLTVTAAKVGEPIDVEQIDRDVLERDRRAVPAHEATQATLQTVSLGEPAAGEEVAIVDAEGRMVAERRVGEIVLRSPSVMDGYYKNTAETQAVLHNGWLRTGDLGYIADGRLFIVGRLKDMVIKRGRNYYPCDIEAAAERVAGIDTGAVVSFAEYNPSEGTENLVVLAESPEKDPDRRQELEKTLSTQILSLLAIRPDRIVLAQQGAMPRNHDGSVRRAECRERYLTDTDQFVADLQQSVESPTGAAA